MRTSVLGPDAISTLFLTHMQPSKKKEDQRGRKEGGGGRTCYSVHTRIRYITAAFSALCGGWLWKGPSPYQVPLLALQAGGKRVEKDWWCAASGVEGEGEKGGENRAMFLERGLQASTEEENVAHCSKKKRIAGLDDCYPQCPNSAHRFDSLRE